MDYSVAIRCSGDMLIKPLFSSGHIRHNNNKKELRKINFDIWKYIQLVVYWI
jgi:hypothetical protein